MRLVVLLFFLLSAGVAGNEFSLSARLNKADSTARPFLLYSDNVDVVYNNAVICLVEFNADLVNFTVDALSRSPGVTLSNFLHVGGNQYQFEASRETDGGVQVWFEKGSVQDVNGATNDAYYGLLDFQSYRYAPSVSLLFETNQLLAPDTNSIANTKVWIFLNSTTQVDNTSQLDASMVSIYPPVSVAPELTRYNDTHYFMGLGVLFEDADRSDPTCVPPGTPAPGGSTVFPCQMCRVSGQVCQLSSIKPPSPLTVSGLELSYKITIQAMPYLSINSQTILNWRYDTLWPLVNMEAPPFIKDTGFVVDLRWSEPMLDVAAHLPVFSPPCTLNVEVVSSSRLKIHVVPNRTATYTIMINGTELTVDSARNGNQLFADDPDRRTGSYAVTVFALGPPPNGTLSFKYTRQTLAPYEYQFCNTYETEFRCLDTCVWTGRACLEDTLVPDANESVEPNVTLTWTGFDTAMRYDVWVEWADNFSLPVDKTVTSPYLLSNFTVLLGVEYLVCVRAWNPWDDQTTTCSVLSLPTYSLLADGRSGWMALPNTLGPTLREASVELLVRPDSFMSVNPLHVLTLRAVNSSLAGGAEPDSCEAAAVNRYLRCTMTNFHMEVPNAQFVIFKEAVVLKFDFGPRGWNADPARSRWTPQLRYWNTYTSEWAPTADTCTRDKAVEAWNLSSGVYTVSVCHLSQFALFEHDVEYIRPETTTTTPSSRPESYDDPVFFLMLTGVVGMLIFGCGVCYWSCLHRSSRQRVLGVQKIAYGDIGIKAITERMPSQREGGELRRPPRRPPRGRPMSVAKDPAIRREVAQVQPAADHDPDPEEPLALEDHNVQELLQMMPHQQPDPARAGGDWRAAGGDWQDASDEEPLAASPTNVAPEPPDRRHKVVEAWLDTSVAGDLPADGDRYSGAASSSWQGPGAADPAPVPPPTLKKVQRRGSGAGALPGSLQALHQAAESADSA